jgi:hypothetical protein
VFDSGANTRQKPEGPVSCYVQVLPPIRQEVLREDWAPDCARVVRLAGIELGFGRNGPLYLAGMALPCWHVAVLRSLCGVAVLDAHMNPYVIAINYPLHSGSAA